MAEVVQLHHLILLLPVFILSFLLIRSSRRRRGCGRLPPSPWALPVIGHLHHLAGALPHRAMRDIARRHGPLVLLRLGELPVVVASSADAARDVMKTHDLSFAMRPITRMMRLVFPEGSEGIIFSPYGETWRQLRKICTIELLSARRVNSFRSVREEEVNRLLRAVAAAAASATSPAETVNLSELVSAYAADSSVRAMIGRRFKDRDKFLAMLERGIKLLPDLYPSSRLAMVVSRMPRRMRRHREEVFAFLDAIIAEHQENRASGEDEEDLLDVLLRIQREGCMESTISTESIRTTIGGYQANWQKVTMAFPQNDLFNGGSETTATTLQWIMAELMRNPRVMQKARDEVRRVFIGQDKVTEENLSNLSYMYLVIKEALPLHPPRPPLLPRECRTTCQVLGFDVPKGTIVLVNMDPKYWDQPEEFMPERFEHVDINFKGMNFEYMPFGAGRRMCPGMAFGLVNLELVLASLLYHFDWKLSDKIEVGDLDMMEERGATTRRLHDLLLVPVRRRGSGGCRLPPSPWALPVVGHLHHLAGALQHRAMRDIARCHGPLVLLRLGRLPVVVASSADAAREVMRTSDVAFAARPVNRMIRVVFPEGSEGIIFAPYGETWRQLRKICTAELLSARRVHSFRSVREEEAGRMLRAVASTSPAQTVNLSELMSAYAADSSARAMIGRRLKDRDTFLAMVERGIKLFGEQSLPNLYPSSRLAVLLSTMPRRMKRHGERMTAYLDAIIEEHQESRASREDEEDLLDVLLRIQREGDLQVSRERIRSTIGVSTLNPSINKTFKKIIQVES
uniref:Cytochrome P450 n=1 Tax=Oryza meridionalis TaxID=40149 RepID=A0A0E0E483_9ORYZ